MLVTPRVRSDHPWRHPSLAGPLADRVQDQLAALRQRELGVMLGPCMHCGKAVRSQQNFVRQDGYVAHVRCRSTSPPTGSALS